MKSSTKSGAQTALLRLANSPVQEKLSPAAAAVRQHKKEIRKAINRGHSLRAISEAIEVPVRTLQKHLRNEGIFVRRPRSESSLRKFARLRRNSKTKSGKPANI